MARSSLLATTTLSLILLMLHFGVLDAHYTDDSDYGDSEYYKDSPEKRLMKTGNPLQDDFYILSDPGEPEDRNRRVANFNSREETQNRRPIIERVYRYTKHRIPGYDYDELDYYDNRCNERSVWTHCVCQFTCTQPSIVDCYTPCNSGCECREDFVFDERSRQCVKPDQCPPDEDYLFY